MLFNSIEFLVFFVVVTTLYFILPHKYRWFHLLAASCYFYMAFVPIYIVILAGTIVIDYFAGIWIENASGNRRKLFLTLSLIANIGVLAVFKYYNFFIDNINGIFHFANSTANWPYLKILLPIGLSFHTFQAMSYTIEVYRGNQKTEKHFGIYALYVMFYPQLVAGPIERPQNMLHQFHEKHSFDADNFFIGFKLILWGMFKKVVIADRLAILVNQVYNNPQEHNSTMLFIASVFFAVQIYCDFSGYSGIALGTAQVMGFKFMQNFNRPYQSKTISEFWKRWHISLSTWFKDYLYIPLGGNRLSPTRTAMNLLTVFLLCGLWHGASWTFVIWGLYHGVFLIIERPVVSRWFEQKPRVLSHLYALSVVMVGWVFFRSSSLSVALEVFDAIVHRWALGAWLTPALAVALGLGLLAQLTAPNALAPIRAQLARLPLPAQGLLLALIILCIEAVAPHGVAPFIYFRF